MSKKKSFLYYSRVSEGLSTEYKILVLCLERFDKELNKKCRNCHQVFESKKKLKMTMIIAICVSNFYKKKTNLIHPYILCGNKIQNIRFLRTFIVHMLIKYLDMNQSEVKMEVFQMKKLTFIWTVC